LADLCRHFFIARMGAALEQSNQMRETMPQTIGIPKETFAAEKRVASAPEVVEKLIKLGFAVIVESGAGDGASFYDDAFTKSGAKVVGSAAEVCGRPIWRRSR
jgi:NAD/NADP transhydrogenase alpha subunit